MSNDYKYIRCVFENAPIEAPDHLAPYFHRTTTSGAINTILNTVGIPPTAHSGNALNHAHYYLSGHIIGGEQKALAQITLYNELLRHVVEHVDLGGTLEENVLKAHSLLQSKTIKFSTHFACTAGTQDDFERQTQNVLAAIDKHLHPIQNNTTAAYLYSNLRKLIPL